LSKTECVQLVNLFRARANISGCCHTVTQNSGTLNRKMYKYNKRNNNNYRFL